MQTFAYPAAVKRDESGVYVVTFPDVPRCATDGRTRAEALREAADALEEGIAHRIAQGLDVTPPSKVRKGQYPVPLSAQMAAKLALHLALREAGVRPATLARRLGVSEAAIRKILDPRRNTRLDQLDRALAALGKRLVVHTEAA